MSQEKLSLVKKFRLSPREASMLADKAQQANMTESEYLRLMISQKRLVVYMRKLNTEVNNVYKTVNEGKFGNE